MIFDRLNTRLVLWNELDEEEAQYEVNKENVFEYKALIRLPAKDKQLHIQIAGENIANLYTTFPNLIRLTIR